MAKSTGSEDTAILFQANNTVFLLDIPHSITLAQGSAQQSTPLSSKPSSTKTRNQQRLLSCSPLKEPYPSTEPKNPSARAKVLETVPLAERQFHSEVILPLVKDALKTLRAAVPNDHDWYLPRAVPHETSELSSLDQTRKRRKGNACTPLPATRSVKCTDPPTILSSSSPNQFASLSELNLVKNPSQDPAIIKINHNYNHNHNHNHNCNHDNDPNGISYDEYTIPPNSSFILGTLPLFEPINHPQPNFPSQTPIPNLHHTFNLVIMDPPWPNRSVRRSGHYQTHHYSEMDVLTHGLTSILRVHAAPISTSPSLSPFKLNANVDSLPNANANTNPNQKSLAAIWITNAAKSRRAAYTALTGAGFRVCEEWVWVKITGSGHPISDLEGVWRKPYEILVIGSRDGGANVNVDDVDLGVVGDGVAMRRVIAAVPDLHSRKPCLKGLFEEVFFGKSRYSALEVFARNLTAGWWAVGNEVLRFNARECWVGGDGNWNLE